MAVLLVLATFLVFILIDFLLTAKKSKLTQRSEPALTSVPLLSSVSIEGVMLPDQLRYHPGHTWLFEERPKRVRAGADALALRVIGPIDKIELPKPGHWVRQGQKAFTFWTGAEKIELVSPAEGEVCEVNSKVLADPSLATKDPYGNGWLIKVDVPERETVARNLLPSPLVRTWMKDEVRRVRLAQPQLARVAVMGGGTENVVTHDQSWRKVANELFLS